MGALGCALVLYAPPVMGTLVAPYLASTTTTNMSLEIPDVGSTAGPDYATLINAAFVDLDAHDHTSGKGVPVPVSGLNINANLDMKPSTTEYAVIDGKYYSVTEQSSDPAVANSVWSSTDGELHWRDDDGNDVQITSAGALNAGLTGGIGGDYTTTDAAVEYSDAAKAYLMLTDSSPNDLAANIVAGNIDFCEPDTASVNCVTVQSPTSLAAAFTLTLPTALPSAASILRSTAAGALSFSVGSPPPLIFGDGSDGDADFDGTNTFTDFASKSGSNYALTRDVMLNDLDCQTGVNIDTDGHRLMVAGTATLYGTCDIQQDGQDDNTDGEVSTGRPLGTSGNGGGGSTTNGGNGYGGPEGADTGAGWGGDGGDAGAGSGGTAGSGGSVTTNRMNPHSLLTMILPYDANGPILGGAGGGGGGGDTTNAGGAGGEGGGVLLFMANALDVSSGSWTGAISTDGGDGADASTGDAGGGGGGGGGLTMVGYRVLTGSLVSGTNVTAAAGAGGALSGSGANGSAGSAGTVIIFSVED